MDTYVSLSASDSGIPPALDYLKFNGIRLLGGSIQTFTTLLKRPKPVDVNNINTQSTIVLWDSWWKSTPIGQDPGTPDPKWQSTSRTSDIWKYFKEAAVIPTGQPQVYCLNCGLVLQHPTARKVGTKHLINHQTKSLTCAQTEKPVHSDSEAGKRKRSQQETPAALFSIETFQNELVRLVISNSWSFRTIERLSFHRFVRFLRPGTAIISRYRFGQVFEEQYQQACTTMLQDLGRNTKISIALDAWTGTNHFSFLAIKVYYINTHWSLKEKLLDFIPMRGQHTGVSMAKEVLKVLKLTGLTHRLLGLTSDNASNNSTLSRSLESRLADEGYTWPALENTIPCLAHIINLVVQDILLHLKLDPAEDEPGKVFQRSHTSSIHSGTSVPNSLRKVFNFLYFFFYLLQLFITG